MSHATAQRKTGTVNVGRNKPAPAGVSGNEGGFPVQPISTSLSEQRCKGKDPLIVLFLPETPAVAGLFLPTSRYTKLYYMEALHLCQQDYLAPESEVYN
jgi:hypothetical protein